MNKICTKCLVSKSVGNFAKDKRAHDGLCFRCKECMSAQNKAYRIANREALKEKADKRRAADPGLGARYALKWRQTHPERAKAGYLEYGKSNKEKIAAKDAKRYASNPEKAAAQYAKWIALNPESIRVRAANRRARLKQAKGSHTTTDVLDLLALQKYKCAACACSIKSGYHVDHIVAISRGGSNDRLNLQLLCRRCNLSKHAKDPVSFMQSRGFLL